MEVWVQMMLTIVGSVVASSGFWANIQKRMEKNDVKTIILMGLAHDRIINLGMCYIERGWVTSDEFENLYKYLYTPYASMGGNGSAIRIMSEVKKLPIHNVNMVLNRRSDDHGQSNI